MTASTAGDPASARTRTIRRVPVIAFVALLAGLAGSVSWVGATMLDQPAAVASATAAIFVVLIAAAEQLRIDFRYGDGTDSVNLVEAVVAPLLLVAPITAVVAIVAVGIGVANFARRNQPLKAAFNVAQWGAAAALGALVLRAAADGHPSAGDLPALTLAMAVVAFANQASFVAVLSLSGRRSPRAVLGDLAPVIVPGWLLGWLASLAFGLVFALAQLGAPGATVLFAVPLVVLHLASRSVVGARVERSRLESAQCAIARLREPLDYREVLPDFLDLLCQCFDADVAELLVTASDGVTEHHRSERAESGVQEFSEVAAGVAAQTVGTDGPAAGVAGALTVPFARGTTVSGLLALRGIRGFQGFDAVDRAALDLVAREVAAAIEKTALVLRTIEDRRKLAELGAVVAWSDDAMIGQTLDGVVTMWNAGAERLFGYARDEIVGQPIALLVPDHRRSTEERVLESARLGRPVRHHETEFVRKDGSRVTVSLTVSPVLDASGHTVAVSTIARDIGERKEAEALARRLEEESLGRRQALWLNDRLVQDLAVAAMAMDLGEHDVARSSLDTTLRSARRIVTGLLPPRGIEPGDLVRSPARHVDGTR